MNKLIVLITSVLLLIVVTLNAQTIESVSFPSVAGGGDNFQPVVGAPFGVSASGSGGSLTITSE